MRGFHNSSFDPQTLVVLETAFDEAWLTLKSVGNKTVKPDELARSVLRIAMEGERDPVRLQEGALERLLPATTWREASSSRGSAEQGDQAIAATIFVFQSPPNGTKFAPRLITPHEGGGRVVLNNLSE